MVIVDRRSSGVGRLRRLQQEGGMYDLGALLSKRVRGSDRGEGTPGDAEAGGGRDMITEAPVLPQTAGGSAER